MRIALRMAAAGIVALVGAASAAADPAGTTLERTIVAARDPSDPRALTYGPGERRVVRRLGGWRGGGGPEQPLAGFKHISDVHVLDEESPARVEFFDACGSEFTSAYRPQEALTLQVGESMLRHLASITEGPATGVPLNFVVSTGDNVDNNQYNETRWFIDLLDGDRVIDPNSGAESYDGYTREQFAEALPDEVLAEAQEPFTSTGARLPWYAVLGNHDGLVQGNVPANFAFNAIATGGRKPFVDINAESNCPEPGQSPADKAIEILGGSSVRNVPSDPDRRFLSHADLVEMYTDYATRQAGFADAPAESVAGGRAGYYTFEIGPKVTGIVLDTISYDGGPNGTIDDMQFDWLRRRLKAMSRRWYRPGGRRVRNPAARNRMMVLFSHHSSQTLDNPALEENTDEQAHCFRRSDAPHCRRGGEPLYRLLRRFPNVIAWVNGHEHNNAVRAFPGTRRDPTRGFWEINTASHIDWPQQSRLIEIAYQPGRGPDTVVIYATMVDHGAPPDGQEASDRVERLAAISRREAYYDACVREGQADCAARGRRKDRNVKLVMEAPFELGRR